MLAWPASVQRGLDGVMRGSMPGMGVCRRRVSMMMAWRRGRVSIVFGAGSERGGIGWEVVCDGGGQMIGGSRVRTSLRSWSCRSGRRESS